MHDTNTGNTVGREVHTERARYRRPQQLNFYSSSGNWALRSIAESEEREREGVEHSLNSRGTNKWELADKAHEALWQSSCQNWVS